MRETNNHPAGKTPPASPMQCKPVQRSRPLLRPGIPATNILTTNSGEVDPEGTPPRVNNRYSSYPKSRLKC